MHVFQPPNGRFTIPQLAEFLQQMGAAATEGQGIDPSQRAAVSDCMLAGYAKFRIKIKSKLIDVIIECKLKLLFRQYFTG